jgi:hypothetical protein
VNLAEIGKDMLDEIHGVGPLGMPRPLNPDPRRRRRLRLKRIPCFLFAHRFLVAQVRVRIKIGAINRLC